MPTSTIQNSEAKARKSECIWSKFMAAEAKLLIASKGSGNADKEWPPVSHSPGGGH